MVGGIVLGTLVALMRLSSKPWLQRIAAVYVDTVALDPAADGDPVVLPADPAGFYAAIAGSFGATTGPSSSAVITFTIFEAAYYSEIMRAGIQSVLARPGQRRLRGGHDLLAVHAADRAAAGLPQHAAGAADADHRAVPGHLAGLRDRRLRLAQGLPDRRPDLQPPDEMLLLAAVVYFVLSFSLSMLVRRLQAKIQIIR